MIWLDIFFCVVYYELKMNLVSPLLVFKCTKKSSKFCHFFFFFLSHPLVLKNNFRSDNNFGEVLGTKILLECFKKRC